MDLEIQVLILDKAQQFHFMGIPLRKAWIYLFSPTMSK